MWMVWGEEVERKGEESGGVKGGAGGIRSDEVERSGSEWEVERWK